MKGLLFMKLKLLFFGFIFVMFLAITSPILAQADLYPIPSTIAPSPIEYALPYPGILSDHPLYFLKVLRDRILLFFTQDQVKKIQYKLLFADKRLVAGQLLFEQGKKDVAIDTITKGEKYLLDSAAEVAEMKRKDVPPGLTDKIELSAKKHEEVIKALSNVGNNADTEKRLSDALGLTHQAFAQIAQFKQK